MSRTTVEQSRQGLYRLINSRSRYGDDQLHQLEKDPVPFRTESESILSSQHLTVEHLLGIVEWENDPSSWKTPDQVPGGMLVWEYELPMDEQYDELFGWRSGAVDSPNPAARPWETIVDWTRGLLSQAQRPMTDQFLRLAKARVVTFLNLEAPEMDEHQVAIDWIRTQPRATQEETLQRGFSMMYEVHDWMVDQGMTPLSGAQTGMPDLLRLTIHRDQLIAEQREQAVTA